MSTAPTPGRPKAARAPSRGSEPRAAGSVGALAFWPYPRWIAHRGAGKLAPENTLAAFRLGAEHGYRMFECDVKLSRDGVPFLLHDATLARIFEPFVTSKPAGQGTGLGLAMASALMVSDEIASGQLHAPAGFIADGSAYHLLSPQAFLPGCKRQRFAD